MIDTTKKISRVIFDFDNTLFETEALKDIFWQIAWIHGYGRRAAQSFYQEARTDGEKIVIAIESFIGVLKKHLQQDGRKYDADAVVSLVVEAEKAQRLLPGAAELLTWCEEQALDCYLLSLGVAQWQERKIWHSGADHYFRKDHIIFTDSINSGKEAAIVTTFGAHFTGANTAFFNDKPDETTSILERYPDLVALMRREKRDERFEEADFLALEKAFPGRVAWSENLVDLEKILKTLV